MDNMAVFQQVAAAGSRKQVIYSSGLEHSIFQEDAIPVCGHSFWGSMQYRAASEIGSPDGKAAAASGSQTLQHSLRAGTSSEQMLPISSRAAIS